MSAADFDLLIHRYFEGTLNPDEEAVFWERVRTDPASADRFVEFAELESGLAESLKADEEMPSGVYRVIHGTRRRARPLPPRERAAWPYMVAAGLFIAALSMLLRSERTPDRSPELPVRAPLARDRGGDEPTRSEVGRAPEVRTPARTDLEVRRNRQQDLLRDLERKEEELAVARSKAEAEKREPAQSDLEKSLAELQARRREEAATLARVEEDLAKPERTRVTDPAPAPGPVLETVEGEVAWIGNAATPPRPGQPVPAGAGLSTGGARSRLVLKLPGDTRLELGSDGRMEEIHGTGDQMRLSLTKGMLLASVAKQTGARSVVVLTPHAEITVLGTRFVVQVGSDETRLDVEEGKVRNRRLSDKRTVEVAAGHTLSTGKAGPLTPKPLPLVRSFQDGVHPTPDYAGTQDTSIGSTSAVAAGSQDLLRVYRGAGREVENTALLRWDVSSIPPRSRVVAAELSLWVTGGLAGPGARAVEIKRRWDEADATWKLARPGVPWQLAGARGEGDAGTKALAPIVPASTGWCTFPLNEAGLALVQQWVNAPASNFGIGIAKEPPNAWDLASREWATPEHRPKFTVSYIPPAK